MSPKPRRKPLPPPRPVDELIYGRDTEIAPETLAGFRGGVQVPIDRFHEYIKRYKLRVVRVTQLPGANTLIEVERDADEK